MAEEQDPVETPIPAEEVVDEEVWIIVSESTVLEMLRAATKRDADPDLLYAEFWANAAVEQVVQTCDCCSECECCVCEEEDDDCECECVCEVEAEDQEGEGADG